MLYSMYPVLSTQRNANVLFTNLLPFYKYFPNKGIMVISNSDVSMFVEIIANG